MGIKAKQRLFFYMCVVLKLRGYSQENAVFDSSNVKISPLDINTKESEFSPFKAGNRLFYTSSRERRIGVVNLDESTNHQMLDIYYGELKDSVTVTNRKHLVNSINNSLNQGTCFFDERTSKLYYAGNTPSTRRERFKLAIFSSEFKDNKFLKPRIELLLPDTFLASHPMVYKNKLYFSSNLAGGKGKADIYAAELVEGKWSNIKNLEEINSPYDDYFPFVINEKEIYFSSNRPGGFGKLDIYKYSYSDGMARIRNLGKPINSKADDFGLFMEPKQESGYFSTNRVNNQDDIYYFKKTWPTFNNCVAAIKESYCYDLTDEKSLETDSLKGYFYEWDFGDGTKQKGISVNHCYLEPGNYVINLNIIDVSTKAVFMNQTALDLYVDSIVQLKINAFDTMLVNKKFTVNTAGTYLPDKKITGYYFEVDDKRIRRESFEYNFKTLGKHKIKLGVEYEDLKTNVAGLMCTTLEVTCVDSTLWLPFEKKKIDEMVAKFDAKNIQAGTDRLEDLNYDAELKFNQKLGLSKEKMGDKVDDYLSSETTRQTLAKIKEERDNYSGKNIDGNPYALSGQDEEAFLAFKKKLKEDQQKAEANGKNIGSNPYGLSAQEEEAFLAFKNKFKEEQAKTVSNNGKNIGNNKNGLSDLDEEALLVFKFKQQQENGRNIGANPYALSDQEEEAFLAFKKKAEEQKKSEAINGKNIGNNPYGLSDQEEEAFLAFKNKFKEEQKKNEAANGKNIGNNKSGLSDLDEEALLVFKFKQKLENGRNIGANPYALSDQEEEAFLAFKKKAEEQKKSEAINGKNIGNNPYGLSDQEEEAFLAFKNKFKEEQKKNEAANGKNIGNNKSGLSDLDEEALLVFKFKQKQESFNGRNIGNNGSGLSGMEEDARLSVKRSKVRMLFNTQNLIVGSVDTLLHVEEKVNITFRVHLGKSKVKKDTAYLSSIGLKGIKEEFVNNEYSYTYKNEGRVNTIEKYYQKALSAGVKDPVVIAYNNNVLIPNQAHHFKEAGFPEKKKEEAPPVVVKQGLFAKLFKKNKKAVDSLKVAVDSIKIKDAAVATITQRPKAKNNKPVKDTGIVTASFSEPKAIPTPKDTVLPVSMRKEDLATMENSPPEKEKPKEKDVYFFPVAIKPKDVKIEDLPIPEDENVASAKNYTEEFVQKYGDASASGLEFKVQISAFKYRNRYEFPHLARLGNIENTMTEGGITRITIGGTFNNYKKADEYNKKVIAAGQKDAFVTIFYQGKRVYLEDLEKMGIFLTK